MRRNDLHPMRARRRRAASAFSPCLGALEERWLTGGILTGVMLGPFLPWLGALVAPQGGPVGSSGSEGGSGSAGPQTPQEVRPVTPLQNLGVVSRTSIMFESVSGTVAAPATTPGSADSGDGLTFSLHQATKPTKDSPLTVPPQVPKGTSAVIPRRPAAPPVQVKLTITTPSKPANTPADPVTVVAILPSAPNPGTSTAAAPTTNRDAVVAAHKASAGASSSSIPAAMPASPITNPAAPQVSSPPSSTPMDAPAQTLTWTSYGEGSTTGNTVNMSFPRGEFDQQPIAFHGASTLLAPGTTFQITFDYSLYTWDSYNALTTVGTGYWDSFSVSVTSVPYPQLQILHDPLQFPFVWGGQNWDDGILESTSGTTTITSQFNLEAPRYLNVVLDTKTLPTADNNYPSWGTITIDSVAVVSGAVDKLTASLPSTPDASTAVAPADGTFTTTNKTLAYVPTSNNDLMVVLQGAGTITVSANVVQPLTPTIHWEIDQNPADTVATGTPTLGATTGNTTTITPNAPGNFRLIAYLDLNNNGTFDQGEQLKVLRIAIVKATVQAGSASLTTNTAFAGGVNSVTTAGASGNVHAMDIKASILLQGGGADQKIGTSQIVIGNVGNLLSDTFQITYPGQPMPADTRNGVGKEDPDGQINPAPGFPAPMVDTVNGNNPNGGSAPFRGNSTQTVLASATGRLIKLTSLDAPAFGWAGVHPTTGNPWAATSGVNAFREFIVGYSQTFIQNYMSYAHGDWTVTATGTSNAGTWQSNGATVTTPGAITVATQTGSDAGVQVRGPSFVSAYAVIYSLV